MSEVIYSTKKEMETDIISCAHCGEECESGHPESHGRHFCCNGCQIIYDVLQANGLGNYYQIEDNAGISQRGAKDRSFDYLDDPEVVAKIVSFDQEGIAKIRLHLPQIHCSSCIWLLENIHQLNPAIKNSRVNFLEKIASITYRSDEISLRQLVELLTKIGYEPKLSFNDLNRQQDRFIDRDLLYKIGLAGFSFGNIMLLSFPEYLGFEKAAIHFYIGYLNILLALPVLIYSGRDYLVSAYKSIRMKNPGIDVPVALGMIVLFGRSAFEIMSGTGEGYLDSFTGFVFFLLIGKWFQNYSYQSISFDHNYKSYFPISAYLKTAEGWISRSIDQLKKGDIIRVKNEEIIPCDGHLLSGRAHIDYSFVTGESDPQTVHEGEVVLAGGKQVGAAIDIEVSKAVDQSYLTQLWNEDVFQKNTQSNTSQFINRVSKHFTWIILVLAVSMLGFWWYYDASKAFQVFTAVLIVACPCALALSIPFIYGNAIRLLAKNGVYVKNTETIEVIQDVDTIIFDKTGTITDLRKIQLEYIGAPLTDQQASWIRSAVEQSSHPLSKAIGRELRSYPLAATTSYEEYPGRGLRAIVAGHDLRIGSAEYIFGAKEQQRAQTVHIEIDGGYVGRYEFTNELRDNVEQVLTDLGANYDLGMLSGDNSRDEERMKALMPAQAGIYFDQQPKDKLNHIKSLQSKDNKVMMIGDGLNDAGALKQSHVGVVIADDTNNFNPACDVVIDSKEFEQYSDIIRFISRLKYVLYGALVIAFLYNTIGMYFAVTGQLSPVVAAILMPASSLTVMFYGLAMSTLVWRWGRR